MSIFGDNTAAQPNPRAPPCSLLDWNQKQVLSTVVANVASAYFQLRELDLELLIAKNTLASRQESLQLTDTLERGGATSLLDVRQAEQLVETAAESIPETERQIAAMEDMLSTLLGENPHDIPRGLAITEQSVPAAVPVGLPSELLNAVRTSVKRNSN